MSAPVVDVEGLSWGGHDVAAFALHAVDLSGLLALPARIGENVTVPGRDGAIYVARKTFGPREFPIEFLIRGVDHDGRVPPGDLGQQFYANLSVLVALCGQGDLVDLVHTLPDGTERVLPVEVVAGVDPTRYLAGTSGRVTVAFASPSAFWRGTTERVVDLSLTNGQTAELAAFADCDARITDGRVTFRQGINPVLTDPRTGTFTAYDESIGASQSITIGDYRAPTTGGLVFDRRKLRRDHRQGAWFAIDPVPGPDGPTVRLDHNGTGAMSISIAARPAWGIG